MQANAEIPTDNDALTILQEKVFRFVVINAKEYGGKNAVSVVDSGSNSSDDKSIRYFREQKGDAVEEELTSFINSLSEDEEIDRVALAWPGRDAYSANDWLMVREETARAHNHRTAEYLSGLALVGDFQEEGLPMAGRSCAEYEIEPESMNRRAMLQF